LNHIMKKDHYPLPLIVDLFNASGKVCIYTKLDLGTPITCSESHPVTNTKPPFTPTMAPTTSESFQKACPMLWWNGALGCGRVI
jgi:hypothetical protein